MKANGWKGNELGTGLTLAVTVRHILVSLRTIRWKAEALFLGLMEASMKAIIDKEKNMDTVNIYGKMVVTMTEIGMRIRLMGMEYILGLMVESTRDNGIIIKCMETDSILGRTEEVTQENTTMIKSTVLGYIFGLMVVNILVNG